MGYRLNLYFADKEDIKNYNWKKFDYETFYDYKSKHFKYITELGDFLDISKFTTLYEDSDCNYKLLSKEDLYEIITAYHNHIESYYKNFVEKLNDDELDEEDKVDIKFYFNNKVRMYRDWLSYIDMSLDNDRLTKSSRFEHTVYDLIRIYKTTDFSKTKLFLYGG